MSHPELSILIPAAGASERLGQVKQLLYHQGQTLIQNAVDAACSLNPREVIVVTGANANPVKHAIQQAGVCWVHNPDWSSGMGTSIAAGAATVNPESKGLLILLCDQWRIEAKDLSNLVKTWQSGPKRIVCALAEGHHMPPVIFPSGCFEQLRGLTGKLGARGLLTAHPEILTAVPVENAAFDIDTPDQLEQLKNHGL